MATRTAYDFTVGQAVTVSRKVLSPIASQAGRIVAIDTEANEVEVAADNGKGTILRRRLWAGWVFPANVTLEAHDFGRWVTLVGQDGTSRPVTFVGYNHGEALYIEGHVDIRHTLADNIAITN